MLQNSYRRRLGADLPRWREKGWVTEGGAAAILAEASEARSALSLSAVMAVLGALLLGLGIVAFIAANWEEIPRLARFGLLLAGMAASYASAYMLDRRDLYIFAEAAMLLAGLIFAAAIGLIGQSYHLSGDWADAILFWEVGALIAALLVRSNMTATIALFGACFLTWEMTVEREVLPYWEGLALILVAGGIGVWLGHASARVAAVFALFFWIAVTVIGIGDRFDWPLAGVIAVLLCLALASWSAGTALSGWVADSRVRDFGETFLFPSLFVVILLAGALQTVGYWASRGPGQGWLWFAGPAVAAAAALAALAWVRRAASPVNVLAVLVIGIGAILFAAWQDGDKIEMRLAGGILVVIAAIWMVHLGQTGAAHVGKSLGLTFFGLEVFYLYAVTLGTVIDTALAFLLGGVLFIALSFLLFRVDRLLGARKAKEAA